MNWLDIVLLIAVACSVVASFRMGLTREIAGLVSVIAALLLGSWFYGSAGGFLLPYVSSRWVANLAGFVIVFSGVMLAGAAVSFVLGRILKRSGLSVFDRLLGAGFGLARGALIATALVMALMAFSPADQPPGAVVHSRLAPYVIDTARVFAAMAPRELKDGFRRTYGQVKDAWTGAVKKGMTEWSNSGKAAND